MIGLEFEAFANRHRRKFNHRAGLRLQTGMIDVDEQDDYQQMHSIMDRIAKIEMQATVEPVDTKDKLLVAISLVDPSQGRIILRIVDTSNFEKTVQKNTCLAESQAYADVTEQACEPAAASQNKFKLTDKITNNSNSDSLSEHMVNLFKSGSKLLSETQTLQFQRLLQKHSNAFAKSKYDLCCTDVIQHTINTGNVVPVKQNPRLLPVAMQEEADRELSEMLDAGVLGPSMSPWAAPVVLFRKKDGSVRYCIDFRKITSLKKRDSYPLPCTQDCLEALHGSWFSTIDLQSGHWQAPDSKESTNNDLDTVDCHLRVTKKADISKLQGEEIEFENSEQSNQWVQSKNMDEITEAQQNDEVIKLILKMKS
ncbi:unnamed protein product [Mytilus edulis]|uniref:Uncharacterized protein n=1 Tax=Mytilus edulis TaxID=6550 RepID=A0A8S3RHN4_MYTED|nr:unnamed protein product [Mytilus edulis]